MNNLILKEHQKYLSSIDPSLTIINKFEGGMSNNTYLIKNEESFNFVFRVPGTGAKEFVDFVREKKILENIKDLKITNETIYYDTDSGFKISSYIPGNLITEEIDLSKISETLKKIHTSKLDLKYQYDHLSRLNKYEKLHDNVSDQYLILKKKWLILYNDYLKDNLIYPCHGDSQFANIIIDADDNITLLDWEFSGMNDYLYDIACFGNKNFIFALKLLETYHNDVSTEHYIRLYSWRIFQCLQWFNVASYKEKINLSAELNIDFAKVSQNYLNLASQLYDDLTTRYL